MCLVHAKEKGIVRMYKRTWLIGLLITSPFPVIAYLTRSNFQRERAYILCIKSFLKTWPVFSFEMEAPPIAITDNETDTWRGSVTCTITITHDTRRGGCVWKI